MLGETVNFVSPVFVTRRVDNNQFVFFRLALFNPFYVLNTRLIIRKADGVARFFFEEFCLDDGLLLALMVT